MLTSRGTSSRSTVRLDRIPRRRGLAGSLPVVTNARRVAVTGVEEPPDEAAALALVRSTLGQLTPDVLITGGARGVDTLAIQNGRGRKVLFRPGGNARYNADAESHADEVIVVA